MGCGSSSPDPLERLKKELDTYPEYSVILADMREEGFGFFTTYQHLYHIVFVKNNSKDEPSVGERFTGWYQVSKEIYEKYKPCLGMAILSKDKDGNVSDVPQPPGYQFVGDPRFGRWTTDSSGNQVWEWLGKYFVIASLIEAVEDIVEGHYKVRYRDWEEYRTSMSKRKPYFGPKDDSGKPTFGSFGKWTERKYPTFFERQWERIESKKSTFSERVAENMGKTRVSTFRSRTSSGGFFGGLGGGGK